MVRGCEMRVKWRAVSLRGPLGSAFGDDEAGAGSDGDGDNGGGGGGWCRWTRTAGFIKADEVGERAEEGE